MKTSALRGCFTAFLHTVRLPRQHSAKETGASQLIKALLQGAAALNLGDLRPKSKGSDEQA